MTRALTRFTALAASLLACSPAQPNSEGHAASETSGGETSGGETSTTTGETGDGGFVPDVDQPWRCDMFAQDCPAGQKCVFASSTDSGIWDTFKCVPVLGDQAAGEPCVHAGYVEATDDCDAFSMCWDVEPIDGQLVGACAPFCSGNSDDPECPPGRECVTNGSGDLAICEERCNPLVQDCEAGRVCTWVVDEFECAFPIGPPAGPGQVCTYVHECAVQNMCMSADALPACDGSSCCTPFCALSSGDGACAVVPGTSCVAFFDEGQALPGYEDVGVCVVP